MGYFDHCLYFSGNQLARHMNKIAEQAFENINITPTQGFTLILISEKGKNTPSEIAEQLEMKPSTITRFLDKLQKIGYIEREYFGRKTKVNITEAGSGIINEIYKSWKEVYNIYTKTLGKERSQKLSRDIIEANKILTEEEKRIYKKI